MAAAQHLVAQSGDIVARSASKPFMIPILQSTKLKRDSPFLRLALRPDVMASVARYLGMVPILTNVEVYYSTHRDVALASSQLFHCCDTPTPAMSANTNATAVRTSPVRRPTTSK